MSTNGDPRRQVTYWDGNAPEYDAAVVMTVYMAATTLEEALQSIFDQVVDPGTTVQLIVGVDPSTDGSWQLAQQLVERAPEWITVDLFENELPGITIGGRKTGRSNFLNCYSRIRAPIVLFLDCDDAWRTPTKLAGQIAHVRQTGRAVCTSLETEAPTLKKINDEERVRSPFRHGTTTLLSSFAMPYFPIPSGRFWWRVPFLDLPIMCIAWQRFGIDRLTKEVTFYRLNEGGGWSSQSPDDKHRLVRDAVIQMIRSGPYSPRNKWHLWQWYRDQRPQKPK